MDKDKENQSPSSAPDGPRPFSDIQPPKKPAFSSPKPSAPEVPEAVAAEPVNGPVDVAEPVVEEPEQTEAIEPTSEPVDVVESVEPVKPADEQTDEAVDDITKQESDDALKAQDEVAEHAFVMKQTFGDKVKNAFANWWGNPRRRYGTLVAVVLIIGTLMAVPFTRFNILGLFLKAPSTVQVVDKNGVAVSGATVKIGNASGLTEANGKATLQVNAGTKTVEVTKKYYEGSKQSKLVTLSGNKNNYKITVKALGQPIKVTLTNKITAKPAGGVTIAFQGTKAKTDSKGVATVVVASGTNEQEATVSGGGFKETKITLVATDDKKKNSFSITPAGKLYFLSNLSGKLDVVKTNLDGTERQTVLAGTGNEDRTQTSLLASRDWNYLALLSRRAGEKASIYLIDTTKNDKLTTIDEGNADFSLVGWSDSRFVYSVTRNTVPNWQPNQAALKSYNALSGQSLLLDQTQGSGTSATDYVKQQFGSPYIIAGQVVYAKNWSSSTYSPAGQIAGKSAELTSIGVDGSGHKIIKTFTDVPAIENRLSEPSELYIAAYQNGSYSFYQYADGKFAEAKTITNDEFFNTVYPSYLLSPSGSSTFWSEPRDGKNTLFTGDKDAKNEKLVASLSAYDTYGWYTDDYLLVSKGSSELYILPNTGGTPFKITDYYKPAVSYNGYGGGYGGR